MINKLIPSIDKLKHFYLWSIFLAICLMVTNYLFMPDFYAYGLCLLTAIGVEEYQKRTKTGQYELKDIFFGGVLPILLHLITTI